MSLPTPDDVLRAARVLKGQAHRTPVLTSGRGDARVGSAMFLKCENFQRVGAFKFRGAFTALAGLTAEQRRRGVVAYSSGNHAQAMALAAREWGAPATIVMPWDAPAGKVAATQGYGARVVRYDRYTQDREKIGADLADEGGLALIPPYDHPDVIAGQGTATLELLQEVEGLDVLLVPVGGGGLISGAVLAARAQRPDLRIIGVEPEAGNDAQRSLAGGSIVHIDTPRTLADGAQTQHLGELTFALMREGVERIVTVSDAALVDAMREVAHTYKILIEPTAALPMAAAFDASLAAEMGLAGQRVGLLISGGNVDLATFGALMTGPAQPSDQSM